MEWEVLIQASRHSAGGGVTVFTAPTAFTPCVRDFCSWRNNRTGSSAISLQPIDCRGEGGEKWGSRRIPSPQGHGGGRRRTEPGLRQPHSPWAGGGRGVGLKQTPPTAYRPLLHNSHLVKRLYSFIYNVYIQIDIFILGRERKTK